ncbi:Glycosyltransferase involved in cell wall bisynthesis [Candidatus Methanophagaceae archaeon]|nr:Glycosyltransferase involved in cell wall bisynthesis [Methanophagales archaeon]
MIYMKIAFVHPALMDYRLPLFSELNKMYDIDFIFTKQGRGQGAVKEEHLEIPREWSYKVIESDKLMVRGQSVIMYLRLIRELLRRDYDIVLTSTSRYICFPIAKITGKKFIFWTEFWYFPSNSFLRRLRNIATGFIAKHADGIIATGTKAYKAYLKLDVPVEKIFTYPQCAIDYSKTPIKDLREELGLEDKKIVLYVGRIVRLKGVDYLIKSFSLLGKKMENVFLIIVGDGPFRKECENLAEELYVKNIIFTGYKDIEKASYYKACDVFVLPSILIGDQYEAWGLVINEAMAFGKPIITTDAVGAADDLARDAYNGYIVKNKNVEELYDALYKLLSNPELARFLGDNSRRMFEEINDCKKMFTVFEDAINYVCQE